MGSFGGLFEFAFEQISGAEPGVKPRCRRIQFYRPRVFGACLLELLRQREIGTQIGARLRVDRIRRDRPAIKIESRRRFSAGCRKIARLREKRRILGSQNNSFAQCFARPFPVRIEIYLDHRAGEQRIRQVRLEGECSGGCFPRGGQVRVEAFQAALGRKITIPNVALRDAGPSQRELRIEPDCAFISRQRFAHAFRGIAICGKAALQIMLVGLHIFRSAFFRRLHLCLNDRICRATRELAAQLSHDCLREFGLHREHILQVTRVIFRPELLAGVGASEPRCDTHVVAGLPHAPIDQVRHTKFLPDLLRRCIFPFE